MDPEDVPDDDGPSPSELAREEREAMYPMSGYALVEIDYAEPPGEGLTKVGQFGSMAAIEFPEGSDANIDYVVYDADGNAYRQSEVDGERGDRDELPE